MSLDGKISTGANDERDFDKDLPRLDHVKEGLAQYYKLEEETDLYSLNTGRSMAKIGWNEPKDSIEKLPVTFIIVDNLPHLTNLGIENLLERTKKLYIITTNEAHPALHNTSPDLEVIVYDQTIDFTDLFEKLKSNGADAMTIQSGGTLNSQLIREGLINYISLVIAPILVGGKDAPTLIDGPSFKTFEQLQRACPLKLIEAKPLENSYLHVRYQVITQPKDS